MALPGTARLDRFLADEAEIVAEQESNEASSGLAPRAQSQASATPAPLAVVAGGMGGDTVPFAIVNQSDAPSCSDCGGIMIRNGACYKCPNCGNTSGCS